VRDSKKNATPYPMTTTIEGKILVKPAEGFKADVAITSAIIAITRYNHFIGIPFNANFEIKKILLWFSKMV